MGDRTAERGAVEPRRPAPDQNATAGPDQAAVAAPGTRLILVTGGARSGKSHFAEQVATASGLSRVYLATGEAGDGEMAARIARHRAERGEGWRTLEIPLDVADALRAETAPDRIVLLDCLTLWLTNVMLSGADVEAASAALAAAAAARLGPVVMVSNEVGLGLVPETPLGRAFRDAQGRLNRIIAAAATDVFLVASGCPLRLKPAPDPVAALW